MKPGLTKKGYHNVGLWKNGKGKTHTIHRLVGIAFIPNPDNRPKVDHIDEVKTNNHVKNLRWATTSQNGQNRGKQSNNTTVFKGVYYNKRAKKYHA